MRLSYCCSDCREPNQANVDETTGAIRCAHCEQEQAIPADAWDGGQPRRCLCCGNADLWRQKDFPRWAGVLMVALGALLSSIAWGYHQPVWALGILGVFALLDLVLFWWMPDVLVCYRCHARHQVIAETAGFGNYDHQLGERYRQERLRLEASGHAAGGPATTRP